MACFLVPAGEGVVTEIVKKIESKKEKKLEKAEAKAAKAADVAQDVAKTASKSVLYNAGKSTTSISNIFGKTYAIIDSGDNKIVKLPIERLLVLHNKKK